MCPKQACAACCIITTGARTKPIRTWRWPWAWAFDTPFKWTKQVASHFGGTRQGLAISWPGHIKDVGGDPHAVPPHHRHRADHSRSRRHPGARHGQRHQAEADRRHQHGVHLRRGQRQRALEARHAVFRNGRQSRDLSRRLDRRTTPPSPPWRWAPARCRP